MTQFHVIFTSYIILAGLIEKKIPKDTNSSVFHRTVPQMGLQRIGMPADLQKEEISMEFWTVMEAIVMWPHYMTATVPSC